MSLRDFSSSAAMASVLGVGVGAAATLFGLVDPLISRPLPYPQTETLVVIEPARRPTREREDLTLDALRQRRDLFTGIASFGGEQRRRLQIAGTTKLMRAVPVSDGFLAVLGYQDPASAAWREEDGVPGIPILLRTSSALAWYGTVESIIGKTIPTVDPVDSLRVVGLLPDDFVFPQADDPDTVDAVMPLARAASGRVKFVGTLASGVLPSTVSVSLADSPQAGPLQQPRIQSMRSYLSEDLRSTLVGAVTGIGLMLLICGATVGNLALVNGFGRRPNLLIQAMLGARSASLWRYISLRFACVALAGAVAAIVLSTLILNLASRVAPQAYGALGAPVMTWRVVAFSAVCSVTIASAGVLLCGAAGLPGGVRLRPAAGLFIRSYLNLVTQDTGLTEDVVALSVARSPQATADESHRSVGRVIEHLRRLPAVVDAAAGVGAMVDESLALTPVRFHEGPKGTSLKVVTANYFDVLGIELVEGRRFADSEGDVVVISESLARALWPGGGALGQLLTEEPDGEQVHSRVVGIARDVFDYSLDVPPRRTVYRSLLADRVFVRSTFHYVVRPEGYVAGMDGLLRRQIEVAEPGAAVFDVSTLSSRLFRSVRSKMFAGLLATTFGFVALFLCLTGLAGVVSFTTRRRLREVALRAALGATPARLGLWLVQEAVLLTALGIAVGGVLGSWLTRSVAGLLYGVSAADPVTLALTTAGVTVGAVAASVWAVGKTIWLTPATVLRAD